MPSRIPLISRLKRLPRAHASPSAPNPDTRSTPPSTITRPDGQTILSQWKLLGSLNPKSQQYVDLLARLVEDEDNRAVALEFFDDDASIVINEIDRALRARTLRSKLACHSFSMLRKLSGKAGQLPTSYQVSTGANYQVDELIFAGGGFADVRKGKLAEKVVAVKTIRRAQNMDVSKIRKNFCKESVMLMHTSHPNILKLIAVHMDDRDGSYSLISEFMVRGNIMEYIRTNAANRIRLLGDVADGLWYLHTCGIVHGDLKGTNILIQNGLTPTACLADFGLSTFAPTQSFAMAITIEENSGTWSHMAPELHLPEKFGISDSRVSKQADIYAFGMVVYEVLTGRPPFQGEGRMEQIVLRVIEGERPRKPEKAEGIGFGGGTWELTRRCWSENRSERPTADDIHKHFRHGARTSTVMPPGPTTCFDDAETPITPGTGADSARRDFAGLFVPVSQTGMNVVQQVKFVADVMTSGGNLYSAISPPSVQFVRTKPSLFDRLGARIKGFRPALRLGASSSPATRIRA